MKGSVQFKPERKIVYPYRGMTRYWIRMYPEGGGEQCCDHSVHTATEVIIMYWWLSMLFISMQ